MTWTAKRFWTAAGICETAGGFGVLLDTRAVKTPGKAELIVPTRVMAQAIALEWDAQTTTIDPRGMPVTRAANSAIDKVTPQKMEVAELLAAYGDSDLLCYRATAPASLVAVQAAGWDPMLDWATATLNAPLTTVAGVIHQPQPAASLAMLTQHVAALDAFALTALHDLVALSGSLVLGLAAISGQHPSGELWALSRIDEDWQVQQWGIDEEARDMAAHKQAAFLQAERFFRLCRE